MSIFSESVISVKGEPLQLMSVSNSLTNPAIAICTQSRVMLFSDNGEKHDYELQRPQQPTAIEWHPVQQTLAIGWSNGTLTLWQEDIRQAKEETAAHKEAINLIHFNGGGSRMVTADANGLVIVWRGITPMSSYQKEGIMTHCIFADLNNIIKSSNLFFFGGKAGMVCLADDSKHCSEVCKVVGSIKSLMIYEEQNSVIIITSGMLLVQFKISTTEKSAPDKKVKLTIAGDVEYLSSIWIGQALIATTSNENMIRMWNLSQDENYVMTLHEVQDFTKENILNDKLCCTTYNKKTKHLISGTKEGRLVFWKNMAQDESPYQSEQWKALPFINLGKQVLQISIGKNNGIIAARSADQVKIIQETIIQGRMDENVRILQIEANKILIYLKGDKDYSMFMFDSRYNIKSIDCNSKYMMIQSANKIEIHELANQQITQKSAIDKKCVKAVLYNEDLILINETSIELSNFNGVTKQNIQFSESDGVVQSVQMAGKNLILWTNQYFRIYDLGRKELKQVISRKFENSDGSLGSIRSCAINCDGSKVGILADTNSSKDRFMVYDVDLDTFSVYDSPEYRQSVQFHWDATDPRFFGVLMYYTKGKTDDEEQQPTKLFTYFYNAGIKEQDSYPLDNNQESIFAIKIPHIFIIYKTIQKEQQTFRIAEKLMNDFVGLEKSDEPTKRAVINFSYHLSSGNLDEAYKSVKSIQNPAVWEKMAQMSVKTRRLDVAEICIGNMRFARGSKAIREAKDSEFDAQLATVALQLGMISEAEKLYISCKRYDLLNDLYQANGQWEKALEIAEKHDRINLLATYYKLARNYEISKEYDLAIEFYEKSGNNEKEVPRMFLEADELQLLQDYVEKKKSPSLYKWWANYMESQESFDESLKYYRLANDSQGVVRILIHSNNVRMAKDYCNEKADPAAYYYLAKYLESQNIVLEAIQYYAKAQYFSEAVRLAKDQNQIAEVMALSLQAPKQVQIQSAVFFENKNIIDKSVVLYMKGGQLQKALALAQKQKLTEYVRKIQQEMALQEQQPQIQTQAVQQQSLQRQATTTIVPGSIQDLLNRKQFEKALDLCLNQNLPLTDDLIKKMIDETEEKKKKDIQILIAETAKKMGNHDIASKIYIQLGERVKAVKALIKLGDTEKVIQFANNARMAEIYILAGNFLQTGDWHKTPELMKYITQFYNKAKAFDHLAVFFDACSTVEIDEYRDYEKASAALGEAIKHSQKSTNQQKTQQLQQKLALIQQFVKARSTQNPQEMLQICADLLANPNIEYAIRQGDIHAELVEFYYSQRQFDKAYEEMQKMAKKSILLNPYLDQEIIQNLNNYAKKNMPEQTKAQSNKQIKQEDEEFQEEEIIDDNI